MGVMSERKDLGLTSAGTKVKIMQRRAILLQVLNQHASENPTYERIAELMLEDKFIADNWPGYDASAAWKDFDKVTALRRKDNRDLAALYFDKQLETAEKVSDKLLEFVMDDELSPKLRIDATKALRSQNDQIIRMFGNYAPKETHSRHEHISATIDDLDRLMKEANKQLEAGVEVIDGEID